MIKGFKNNLMEIVVNIGKGGFKDSSYQRNHGEFADSPVKNIVKKSNKYSGVKSKNIY